MNNTDPVDVLARTMWGEARGEGYNGITAIANVVMNRVAIPCWWGENVIDVCLKPYQFSCRNDNDPNLPQLEAVDSTDPIFSQCLQLARSANDGSLQDITNGATSYYDRRMPTPPNWATTMFQCAIIGHHLFFKAQQ